MKYPPHRSAFSVRGMLYAVGRAMDWNMAKVRILSRSKAKSLLCFDDFHANKFLSFAFLQNVRDAGDVAVEIRDDHIL